MINSLFFERIRKSDKILIFNFCVFMIWANLSSMRLDTGLFDTGTYTQYYNNKVIKSLNNSAFLLDIVIFLHIVLNFFIGKMEKKTQKFFIFLLFAGILLIWLELYHGSTFYYGEIRGMQMLPFLVNNFGVLGSTIFLRQIFKELPEGRHLNKILIIKKYPFLMAILLNLSFSLALNRAWSFHLDFNF